MKFFKLLPPLILVLSCQSMTEEPASKSLLPFDYRLDGSVSYLEVNDTVQMTTYYTDEHLIIKETSDRYYVGIRSNRKTILGAYYVTNDIIKVIHASGALGETNFLYSEDKWIKDRKKWDWRYRDTVIWGRYHKTNYLHKEPIQDFSLYYETFGWVANTISFGSDREMELIISKDLIKDISDLSISYEINTDSGAIVITGPDGFGITKSDSLNALIHEGALPLLPDTLSIDFFQVRKN